VSATAVRLLVQQRRHRYGRFEPEKVNGSAGLAQEIGIFWVARLTRPLGGCTDHVRGTNLMETMGISIEGPILGKGSA
jgi:hypothetical protein